MLPCYHYTPLACSLGVLLATDHRYTSNPIDSLVVFSHPAKMSKARTAMGYAVQFGARI